MGYHHRCGTEIDVDTRWNGLVHRVVFLHDGEEISECPGCGEPVTAWLECGPDRLVYRHGALLDERPTDLITQGEAAR